MKLSLIFIAMDLLTLVAYPIVFLHNKLHQVSKSNAIVPVPSFVVVVPVRPGK
jgi:hypothetical protein